MKKINGYLLADVSLIITVILIICAFSNKSTPKYSISSAAVTVIILLLQAFFGKKQIKNNSEKTIYAKNENGKDVSAIKQGNTKSDIDGVTIAGTVYKIPDGVHVVLNDNKVIPTSFLGGLIYLIHGGVLNTPPDENWTNLFNIKQL